MNRADIRDRARSILPAEAFLSLEEVGAWPQDVEPPAACLAPGTEEELAAVLREASARGWGVLPAGLGGWLQGWGAPGVDVVVTTRRLTGMEVYEPADLTFTARAGTPISELEETTADNGQWLPLDPPGARNGTLGALAANGVSGPLRLSYGAPRDHILGLTLVSGDGRVLRWGGRVVKNVAGFDVTRLSIGSRGVLGIITSVSARLFPIPREDRTLLISAGSSRDLLPLARWLARSSMPISALELLDPLEDAPGADSGGRGAGVTSGAEDRVSGGAAAPGPGSRHEAGLVVRLMGTGAQVEAMAERIAGEVGALSQGRVKGLQGEKSREFHDYLAAWETDAWMVARLSMLPDRLGTVLDLVQELKGSAGMASRAGIRLAAHVGWGLVRVVFRGPCPQEEAVNAADQALGELRTKLERNGGGLTVSEGPRSVLRRLGEGREGTRAAGLMRNLKKVFDPAGIMVPGRLGNP